MREPNFRKLMVVILAALGLLVASAAAQAADKPLSHDDVTLLLIGGASSTKVVDLIKERGVDFQLTAEMATEFRRDGADEAVIQALQNASGKGAPETKQSQPAPASSAAAPSQSSQPPNTAVSPPITGPAPVVSAPVGADGVSPVTSAAPGPGPSEASPRSQSQTETQGGSSGSGPVLIRHSASAPAPVKPSSAAPAPASASVSESKVPRPDLNDPSAEQIQHIIQAFAAKETLFKAARDNYAYHQINKVQELGPDGEVTGQYQQDWDILYDDNGGRIERVTYAPLETLKRLQITEEDLDAFRSIQPFVLTTSDLPEYDIQYKGHVQVDQLTAYVFSLRPKVIQKGKQYFQGLVWVDDRDLQIVKSEGKQVPELRPKHGQENLFPRFTTWREQIDGKFWFPTFTLADDTLYFTGGPVHMKEIIRYTEYKQFKTSHKITNVAAAPPAPPLQKQKNSPQN